MSDSLLMVYNVSGSVALECRQIKFKYEKEIQGLIESNMEQFFGVRLLQREYCITEGRMDSIGIDENNSPVIFEYKLNENQNVINQGLFYLDWLLDHKGNFTLLVQEKFGQEVARKIDWSQPALICVARDFTRYDLHAIKQIERNIRLVRYSLLENKILILEHLNILKGKMDSKRRGQGEIVNEDEGYKANVHLDNLNKASEQIKNIYQTLCDYIDELGDDITSSQQKFYLAYKRLRNFACIIVQQKRVIVNLRLDPSQEPIIEDFSFDMSNKGHYGTGDYRLSIKNLDDVDRALPFIKKAYEQSS